MPFPLPGPVPCLPWTQGAGIGNFTICGYNADSSIDLGAISHFYTYFNQVRTICIVRAVLLILNEPHFAAGLAAVCEQLDTTKHKSEEEPVSLHFTGSREP